MRVRGMRLPPQRIDHRSTSTRSNKATISPVIALKSVA